MKICVVTSVHFNDDNRIYKKEILSLLSYGHSITYIAPGVNKNINNNINYIDCRHLKSGYIRTSFRLFKEIKKLDSECIHFHDPELLILGFLVKLFTNKKVIYDVHEDYPSDIMSKAYLSIVKKIFFYAAVVLLELFGKILFTNIIVADDNIYKRFKLKKTIKIYNYPILSEYDDFNIDNKTDDYDIIYAGMLTVKMVEYIVKAVKYVNENSRDIRVLLISPYNFSGGKETVINLINGYGVKYNQFTLLDRVAPSRIPPLLFNSRIGVIPLENTSKMRKNVPTKLFEYMAAFNLIISNDLPPIRNFDVNGENIYFCDTSNDVLFGQAILHYLSNHDYRQLLLFNRRKVYQSFSWESESIKLEKLYEEIYGKK